MNLNQPIVFEPIYQQRVWGGRVLETLYNRPLADDEQPYGESWEVVDRPEALSVVSGGDGETLASLWSDHRGEVFGEAAPDEERFPLLCKILDCQQRLSLQVHPPAAVAAGLGGEPKTEMWYVAAADPGAELYVGLRAGVDREAFETALREGDAEALVHRVEVQAGEFLFIPSGRLHAIGGGLLIFEIQQNSDTTYRVFDWNRLGLDGQPRQLHVDESLQCIDFKDVEPAADPVADDGETLVVCDYFKVSRWTLAVDEARSTHGFAIVTVIEGKVLCGENLFSAGDFFMIPDVAARGNLDISAAGPEAARVLITTWPDVAPGGLSE